MIDTNKIFYITLFCTIENFLDKKKMFLLVVKIFLDMEHLLVRTLNIFWVMFLVAEKILLS